MFVNFSKTASRISSAIALCVCFSSYAQADDQKLVFDSQVEVSTPEREGLSAPVSYPMGAEVPLAADKVYWIAAKGKVPVIVLPARNAASAGAARMKLIDVATWPSSTVETELEKRLTSALADVFGFQSAMAKKDVAQAERHLQRLESGKQMDYLYFLRASLAFIKGDLMKAKEEVKKGLEREPANEQGQRMLKSLEGVKQ